MATRSILWRLPWILAVCLGLALIGPGLAGVAGAGEKPKLVVWWNKGYYKEEDEGMQKVAEAFAARTTSTWRSPSPSRTTSGPRSSAP